MGSSAITSASTTPQGAERLTRADAAVQAAVRVNKQAKQNGAAFVRLIEQAAPSGKGQHVDYHA